MRISQKQLRQIILQEMSKASRQKRVIKEGSAERPIKITPQLLNRIIREEYALHQRRQRLAEARRRRLRAERLAEARSRKNDTVYYY